MPAALFLQCLFVGLRPPQPQDYKHPMVFIPRDHAAPENQPGHTCPRWPTLNGRVHPAKITPGGVVHREPLPHPLSPQRHSCSKNSRRSSEGFSGRVGSGSLWKPPSPAPNAARDSPSSGLPVLVRPETARGRDSTGRPSRPCGCHAGSRSHQGAPSQALPSGSGSHPPAASQHCLLLGHS